MVQRMIWRFMTGFLALWAGLSLVASAQERPERALHRTGSPVVIELFTSQSCDTCGRANRLLGELAEGGDVIALTFPVDYWDEWGGWRDTFAQSEFTRRQRAYRRALGARGLHTPEIVMNGVEHVNATRPNLVQDLLASFRTAPLRQGPRIAITRVERRTNVAIGRAAAPPAPADVWLVTFDPGPIWQSIGAGDNRGHRMPHYNLALSIRRIGEWNGAPANFDRVQCPRHCAVLVQAPSGGPILAAARTPPPD